TGIGFAYEPILPAVDMGGAIPFDVLDAERDKNRKTAQAAVAAFEAIAKRRGVTAESRLIDATFSGAPTLFGSIIRAFDLAIVGQADSKTGRDDDLMVESALFDSGRPVLVVPYIQEGDLKLDRVMACWDGGRNAARAFGDAMPFMTRAKAVDVVTV